MTLLRLAKTQFNPVHTFENGQCFRWQVTENGYVGVVKGSLIQVEEVEDAYTISVLLGDISREALETYFDLETDYAAIEAALQKHDKWLEAALSHIQGLRILKQEPFEVLISFIISSNNNIPKIKMSIEDLCERFGEPIGEFNGKMYFAFPTLENLASCDEEALKKVRAIGYRAKAIYKTVQIISQTSLDLDKPNQLSLEEGVTWLTQFYGVGEKVAHCVLLFGYYKTDAYPIDTWVKKLLSELYGVPDKKGAHQAFIKSYFTQYSGYAQQLLFYYMRCFYTKVG